MNLAASYAVARMLASRPVQRKRAFVLGSNVPPKPVASALCVGPSSRPDLSWSISRETTGSSMCGLRRAGQSWRR